MYKYPCDDCILLGNCSNFCDKLLGRSKVLKFLVDNGRCPDCGGREIGWDGDRNSIHFLILCSQCRSVFVIYPNTTIRPYKGSPVKMRAHLTEGKLFNHKKYRIKISISDFVDEVLKDVKYFKQLNLFED